MGCLFAATHPDRCERLVLYSAFARAAWAPDYDWTLGPEERDQRTADAGGALGRGPHGRAGGREPDE